MLEWIRIGLQIAGYRVRLLIVQVIFIALLQSPAGLAQNSSSLRGTIQDASKSAIPGAKLRIVHEGGQPHFEIEASNHGEYELLAIPPGLYKIHVEHAGFRNTVAEAAVEPSAAVTANITLAPADSKQIVEVSAEINLLDTTTGSISATFNEKEISVLPIAGRSIMELAALLPGVTGDPGSEEGGIFQDVPTGGAGLSVGGSRAGGAAFIADGASANSVGIGRSTVSFSPEATQEFQVIPSTFSAKYGVSGGGVINVVSRQGGDRIRGTLYWIHRNPALEARQFNRPIPPHNRRNELGITFGGPVVIPKIYNGKQKTFFFASVEPKRFTDAIEIYDRFPTAAERLGDFRNSYVAPGATRPLLYQQVRCAPSPQSCKQLLPINRPSASAEFPLFSANDPDPTKRGLVIPKEYLDPVALDILKDVPMPNTPYDNQGRNYFGTRGVQGSDNRWSVKVDHYLSGKNRVSARFTDIPNFADRYRIEKSNLFLSYPSDRSITRQATAGLTSTLTPRIISELRATYTYSDYSRSAPGDLATTNFTTERFGLPNSTGWGFPQFNAGYGTYGINLGANLGSFKEHQYQLSEDVTFALGKHTLYTGFDGRLLMLNSISTGLKDMCCGTYAWAAAQTNSGNANTLGGTGGNQFAAFLTGVPNTVTLRGLIVPYYYRWKTAASFFQDDWKVAKGLTLNLGIRWQWNSPRSEKFNRQAAIDLAHPTPVLAANGDVRSFTFDYLYSGFNGRSIYLEQDHKLNFEPRFGFAWQPKFLARRNAVLRGGYGISHPGSTGRGRDPVPDFGGGTAGSWTYTRWQGNAVIPKTQAQDPNYLIAIGRNPPVVKSDPKVLEIPSNGILCMNCTPLDPRVPTGVQITFAEANRPEYVQNWNFTLQSQVFGTGVLTMTYQGSKGTHLYSPLTAVNNPDPILFEQLITEGRDPNELIVDPLGRKDTQGNPLKVTAVNLLRPFPQLGDVQVAGITNAKSIYHAGLFSFDRNVRRGGGFFRVNYTWSKSIDTASDGNLTNSSNFLWGPTREQNSTDLKSNRAVSLFDQRHRMNVIYSAPLPFGKGKLLLREAPKPVLLAISDWTVSGTVTIASGTPYSPYLGDGNGIPGGATGAEVIRPDVVPGVPLINPRWSKSVANDVPYFNPEAFARPAYGLFGNAPRAFDYARNPWKQTANMSVLRDFRPFEDARRYFQIRGEAFNVLNHATFTSTANETSRIFATNPPVTRTGLSLAGPLPYLVNVPTNAFKTGSREQLIASNYNQNFGKLWRDRNGPGRIIQVALRFYF